MQVTKEGIERIKSASDLAAIVAERGIELKKKGRQLVAPCPFHKEKTASFNVSSAKGLFHCFGCGASGDVIGFFLFDEVVAAARERTPGGWWSPLAAFSRSPWRWALGGKYPTLSEVARRLSLGSAGPSGFGRACAGPPRRLFGGHCACQANAGVHACARLDAAPWRAVAEPGRHAPCGIRAEHGGRGTARAGPLAVDEAL